MDGGTTPPEPSPDGMVQPPNETLDSGVSMLDSSTELTDGGQPNADGGLAPPVDADVPDAPDANPFSFDAFVDTPDAQAPAGRPAGHGWK